MVKYGASELSRERPTLKSYGLKAASTHGWVALRRAILV